MPPSSAVISTYLPCPTAHFVRSRQVSVLVKADASGPGDLDDALDRDVPQRHIVQQRPVLLDRVGVVARQVHVVVDVVGAAAGLEGLLEERRAAVPRPEIEGRRVGRRGRRERSWLMQEGPRADRAVAAPCSGAAQILLPLTLRLTAPAVPSDGHAGAGRPSSRPSRLSRARPARASAGRGVAKPSARTFGSSATWASGSPWTRKTRRG